MMIPKIISVDRSTPVGKLVGDYGDDKYWLGFGHGYLLGIATSFLSCFLGLWMHSIRYKARRG